MIFGIVDIIFAVIFVAGAIFFWRRTAVVKSEPEEATDTGQFSLLMISVPKNNDRTPQAAEQMFAAIHGIFRAGESKQPQISFEIVSRNKQISFYIYTPRELKDFILSQIYAQYPNVDAKEIDLNDDYADAGEEEHMVGTELTLKKPPVYPIKSFQNFEVDPLSAITGVLSSAGADEEIWAQVVIRPIDDEWQEQGITEIKNIKEPPLKNTGFKSALMAELKAWFTHGVPYAVTHKLPEEKKEDKKKEPKELAGPVQQAIKGIEEKITKLGYEVTIRLVAIAPQEYAAKAKLEQATGAFKQFNTINQNAFIAKNIISDAAILDLYKAREIGVPDMIFNITELASIYHFPSQTVATPTIQWSGSKKGEPPGNLPLVGTVPAEELTVFAETNFRNEERRFGIKSRDRRLHTYIIGKTGTGKSTFIENMIFDDIREGRGVAVVDPHGETVQHVLDFVPPSRVDDVIYFNPADVDFPIGFNILESVNPELRAIVASGAVGIFKKIFGESWGPRLEYILRNAILALLDYPNSTLIGVMRILTDTAYRRVVVSNITDPVIKDFFVNEYEKYDPKFRNEAIAPIQNKVGQFLSSSIIRNVVGQPKSSMDISQIMDTGKILLADLSTGKIGEDNSALLGSMLITKIQLAAMQRAYVSEAERRDFYLYVDEFQNFATDSFATILSEARKYHLNLVMTNQYISQLSEAVAGAIFGNVGTMIAFRVGASDAQVLQKEFEPVFEANDLINQANYHIYIKMAIDGVTVPAFSAGTLPPPADKDDLAAQVKERSRAQYGRPRADVEEYIAEWSTPISLNSPAPAPKTDYDAPKAAPQVEKPAVISEPKPEAKPEDVPYAKPEERGNIEQKHEPVGQVQNSGGDMNGEKDVMPTALPQGKKIQIIKDRFDRPWYAVGKNETGLSTKLEAGLSTRLEAGEQTQKISETKPLDHSTPLEVNRARGEQVEEPKITDTQPDLGGGGEPEEKGEEHLISWDKASELGLKLPENEPKKDNDFSDQFEPIDEL